jgi:hypothetical protein
VDATVASHIAVVCGFTSFAKRKTKLYVRNVETDYPRRPPPSTFVGLLSYGSITVVAYRTVLSGAIARTVAEYPTLSRSMANA